VSLASLRSLLFAPGSDEHKLCRALEAGADAVIADLEDAVASGRKDEARALVGRVLAESRPSVITMVRVNGAGTSHFDLDLALVGNLPLDAIVLPKATPASVAALGPDGPPVIAIVETAQGLRLAYETASHPRVEALVLGAVDLGLELGLQPRPDGQEVLFARSKLVMDSAAAGIRGPFDLVHVDVRDNEGLEAESRLARSLGFRGKVCIHPAQVEIVNAVFAPGEDELARARQVVEAYAQGIAEGRGAIALDGEMIDLPVVERARQLIADDKRRHLDAD
jgi:citrate lyase subunit beta/citryl-CoA lyase